MLIPLRNGSFLHTLLSLLEKQTGLEPANIRLGRTALYQLNYCFIYKLAHPEGLQPSTRGLEDRCSMRLSYERIY